MTDNILLRIAKQVSERVAARKLIRITAEMRALALGARTPHDFAAAFKKPGPNVIAEIKFASPSEGRFDLAAHLSPAQVAAAYLQNGAAALSILTEEDNFGGNLKNISTVRAQFPEARILQKDFVTEEYQLFEARHAGADAILLIISLLGKARAAALLASARALGLAVLVEVHDEAELQIAYEIGAELIGVNNRNLKTLQISLEVSERLAEVHKQVHKKRAGSDRSVLISESGLKSRADLSALARLGFGGFLIGSSLMKTGHPGESLHALLETALKKIKVCGLTRLQDAEIALEQGAWALGFIFARESPRCVRPEAAQEILHRLRKDGRQFKSVGVFVNESGDSIARIADDLALDAIQLHGDESAEFCASLKARLPHVRIIKAARPASISELAKLRAYKDCDALLLDTFVPNVRGGSGVANDFQLAAEALRQSIHSKIILSGGLNASNLESATAIDGLYALDLSSGVEEKPGVKSERKLHEFFGRARELAKMRKLS